jgi:hypothetical protein
MITRTRDFALASLLCSYDCKLVNYTTDDLGQMWFEFEDTETVHKLERDFYLATASANVRKYAASEKFLKSLIYENRKVIYENRIGKFGSRTATTNHA